MEIRRGVVTRVKTAQRGRSINPIKEYIVSVDLDGYRVTLEHASHSGAEIRVGDRIAVYGEPKLGVFNAHAFRNFTTDKTSSTQVRAMLYVSLIALLANAAVLQWAAWPFKAAGFFLTAFTLSCIYSWHHTSKGLKQLKLLADDGSTG